MTGPCLRIARVILAQACIATAALGLATTSVAQDAQEPARMTSEANALFAIVYSAGPSWRPGVPMQDQGLVEHFYYMRDLHASGATLLAGPFGDDGGIVLLRAADLEAAQAIMAADPAVTSGLFVGEVRRFDPRFVGEAWPQP